MYGDLTENDLLDIELRNKGNRDVEELIFAVKMLRDEVWGIADEHEQECKACRLDRPEY